MRNNRNITMCSVMRIKSSSNYNNFCINNGGVITVDVMVIMFVTMLVKML